MTNKKFLLTSIFLVICILGLCANDFAFVDKVYRKVPMNCYGLSVFADESEDLGERLFQITSIYREANFIDYGFGQYFVILNRIEGSLYEIEGSSYLIESQTLKTPIGEDFVYCFWETSSTNGRGMLYVGDDNYFRGKKLIKPPEN